MSKSLDNLRRKVLGFRDDRARNKEEAERLSDLQPELLALIKSADPDQNGIVLTDEEDPKGTAFYQQNSAQQFWDVEAIMEWLQGKGKTHRMAVTSRTFDNMKWEAEVANGNIPAKVAAKFKKTAEPTSPFIRFGKAKKGKSL